MTTIGNEMFGADNDVKPERSSRGNFTYDVLNKAP